MPLIKHVCSLQYDLYIVTGGTTDYTFDFADCYNMGDLEPISEVHTRIIALHTCVYLLACFACLL